MSESTPLIFRKFSTEEEARELMHVLHEHGINSSLAQATTDLEGTFTGSNISNKFEVRLDEKDLKPAEILLEKITEENIGEIDQDHYLLKFSNDELKDVLIHSYEWSEYDVVMSKKLLNERNIHFDQTEINSKKENLLRELAQPESGQSIWIIIGYISAFLGGFFGLLIGYFLWKTQKNLPNGLKVYAYDEKVRKHGYWIFIISLIIFPIAFLYKFFDKLSHFVQ